VVFKAPREGEVHVFRHGEPYGQVIFVPQKNNVRFEHFTPEERREREIREKRISDHGGKIANRSWRDNRMLTFDDKYKVLASAYAKEGYDGVDSTIMDKISAPGPSIKTRIPKRLLISSRCGTSKSKNPKRGGGP
jgi:hypothetical protein